MERHLDLYTIEVYLRKTRLICKFNELSSFSINFLQACLKKMYHRQRTASSWSMPMTLTTRSSPNPSAQLTTGSSVILTLKSGSAEWPKDVNSFLWRLSNKMTSSKRRLASSSLACDERRQNLKLGRKRMLLVFVIIDVEYSNGMRRTVGSSGSPLQTGNAYF